MSEVGDLRRRFARLHQESGAFLMPNVWDVGSACLIESLGFEAMATTSSGLAASLGRHDQKVDLDEVVAHVVAITAAVGVPLSVDAEDGYDTFSGSLADTVDVLAEAGASGISIEDYRPGSGLLEIGEATERVAVYTDAANRHGMTVTARAENHLYGVDDLEDTMARLVAYGSAGAHVVYAPGLVTAAALATVVEHTGRPVNALLLPGGPSVSEMREIGVKRLSTGGSLAFTAYGAAARAARELRDEGTQTYSSGMLTWEDRERAFDA